MLYKNTVTEECWSLLQELMSLSFLNSFYLVGGTALSLRFGHRISDDLDLFSNENFDPVILQNQLKQYYGGAEIQTLRPVPFGIFSYIRSTKVDFMYWGEKFMKDAVETENVRLGSLEDIMAMKLEAVTGRKTRKDFYDLGILFNLFSLEQGIAYYKQRYPYNDEMAVLKNITNFELADAQPDPVLLNCPSWEETKKIIIAQFDSFFNGEQA